MNWSSINNSEVIIEIGERLRKQRINKKLTQKQLAEKAGLSLFTVAQIEKGNSISLNMLIALLRALQMLDNLQFLVPDQVISPISLLRNKNKEIKRIRIKKI